MIPTIKNTLYNLMATDLVGRPIRKLLWINLKITSAIAGYSHHLFISQPYLNHEKFGKKKGPIPDHISTYHKYLRGNLSNLELNPKVEILLDLDLSLENLENCLNAIKMQIYSNIEISLITKDTVSGESCTIIDNFMQSMTCKYKIIENITKERLLSHIQTSNSEYISILKPNTVLLPNALAEVIRYINLKNKPDLLYADETLCDKNSILLAAFKPSWSPAMALDFNYVGQFISIKKSALIFVINSEFFKLNATLCSHQLTLQVLNQEKRVIKAIPQILSYTVIDKKIQNKNETFKYYGSISSKLCGVLFKTAKS